MDTYSLTSADPRSVPEFSFAGRAVFARLVEAHDGDTVKVLMDFEGKVIKITIRLLGIDAPEVRSKVASERRAAVRARDFLAAWAVPHKFLPGGEYTEKAIKEELAENPLIIFVKLEGFDKYGRVLGTLYKAPSDPVSLNEMLVAEGHAIVYGRPKPVFK